MEMDGNIQGLMNIAEKRLCMCADPTTREYMEALVEEIRKYDEDIAWSLVPQCVRCGGCVEPFGNCMNPPDREKEKKALELAEQSEELRKLGTCRYMMELNDKWDNMIFLQRQRWQRWDL